MPLLPKNVNFVSSTPAVSTVDHIAGRGTTVAFGDFGIQALEGGEITSRQIEVCSCNCCSSPWS